MKEKDRNFYESFRVLDDPRVQIAAATKKWHTKLYEYTASGPRGSRRGEMEPSRGESSERIRYKNIPKGY